MTLVQSLRQLLSGNKILICFIVSVVITSCGTRQSGIQKTEVVPITPKKKNTTAAQEDSLTRKPTAIDIEVPVQPRTKTEGGKVYNIAVILPFNLDQIALNVYADDTTKVLSTDTRNAEAFYTGCMMAREKFVSENLKTNVYFVDDKNDSATILSLFKQKPFPNVDYIIGPIYFKNLPLAASYAKKNQVPLISPFANSMYIKDNPFYFNAYPSLKTEYPFMIEKIKSKFPDKALEVIYDAEDSSESIITLKNVAEKYYNRSNIIYTSLQSTNDIAQKMYKQDTVSERVIFIYSSKDAYVKPVLSKLRSIKNELNIFLSSVPKTAKGLTDSRYPHTVYSYSPYNTENFNYKVFAQKFEERCKKKPDEFVNQGYDLMLHLFNMLDKQQSLKENSSYMSMDGDNIQSRFMFKPVLNKGGGVDYFDNSFLYLYKYGNGIFSLVTP
ncbi:MAG: hypothetical protein JWN78_1139 [Bacteroidota bacterium]|nr:hypothetical protein [Bacteroidota bacterium]